jgi:hypothetical protein
MQVRQEMVPVTNIYDAYGCVSMFDLSQTIETNLFNPEKLRYSMAVMKISRGQILNRKDLSLFDKIDAVTFEHHGMCLKDSMVTRARLVACKKYKVNFIDRDSLVDHMNCVTPSFSKDEKKSKFYKELGQFFKEKLGDDTPYKLRKVVQKLEDRKDLDLADLNFLSEIELIASQEFNWTFINEELKAAIKKASKKLGVYFINLQKAISTDC